ncbi:drug resistance transporter, EmrB/QacA subfamily [Actinopolymorpha cephalotaxi]|uniref:Drug resistance transporter, EmrB/QacA subfamily n=1 Tax=Actinopolymorpha cephalotaxi TaxID=504797 RepID=A0A1I2KH54_9ACTN|nr:MFS transporter [Actinopolymorpha cephalotaxi]NYH84450.1 EmrB/QacA subfamily drug resistance transporter [Actinopolymorpha cephalotaxi]SFF66294.1 drug resistance transporter, EmrB/QacA subfamily [Actinopolymorpha cephalotaxi]
MEVTATIDDTAARTRQRNSGFALAAAVLGFFVVTLDAVVVNVALPSIRTGLGGGISGLQWVVDGYTLMFATLLLSSGSLADRIGARRSFGLGIGLFVLASVACGAAPTLGLLIVARFVQGTAAAILMPASLTLISQAYDDKLRRGRAVGIWALGGAVASSSGPLLGGILTLVDWRLIFYINVPAGVLALWLLRRTEHSRRHAVPFDWIGQGAAVVAMAALTFGAIEAGAAGLTDPLVLAAFAVAVLGVASFVVSQSRVKHPMVPLTLFGSRTFRIALGTGFAFMVGYYGLPFMVSLYLQGPRGLTSLGTGLVFAPMMVIGLILTPFSARIVERFGARLPVCLGLLAMTVGLGVFALLPASTPLAVLSLVMVLVGMGGPLTMPPMTAVLLNHVPPRTTGVASGVFNTSRQLGGAMAVAVFGALLANSASFMNGLRDSLLLAAAVLLVTAIAGSRLPRHQTSRRSTTKGDSL